MTLECEFSQEEEFINNTDMDYYIQSNNLESSNSIPAIGSMQLPMKVFLLKISFMHGCQLMTYVSSN